MNFGKMYIKVFIITLIIAIISCLYSGYIKSVQKAENEKTLFVRNTEKMVAQDLIEQEIEISTIKTISKLLNAYNEKNMTEVKNIDYRLKQNANPNITKKYIESLVDCHNFKLHDVQIEESSIYTISGFFTYSYLSSPNKESTRTYSSTDFIIKKIDGQYVITYLETRQFMPEYNTESDGIEAARKHGKETYGTENLLNLIFEE